MTEDGLIDLNGKEMKEACLWLLEPFLKGGGGGGGGLMTKQWGWELLCSAAVSATSVCLSA